MGGICRNSLQHDIFGFPSNSRPKAVHGSPEFLAKRDVEKSGMQGRALGSQPLVRIGGSSGILAPNVRALPRVRALPHAAVNPQSRQISGRGPPRFPARTSRSHRSGRFFMSSSQKRITAYPASLSSRFTRLSRRRLPPMCRSQYSGLSPPASFFLSFGQLRPCQNEPSQNASRRPSTKVRRAARLRRLYGALGRTVHPMPRIALSIAALSLAVTRSDERMYSSQPKWTRSCP